MPTAKIRLLKMIKAGKLRISGDVPQGLQIANVELDCQIVRVDCPVCAEGAAEGV
jgi:hypothetical protein